MIGQQQRRGKPKGRKKEKRVKLKARELYTVQTRGVRLSSRVPRYERIQCRRHRRAVVRVRHEHRLCR